MVILTSIPLGLGEAVANDIIILGRERLFQEEDRWPAQPRWRHNQWVCFYSKFCQKLWTSSPSTSISSQRSKGRDKSTSIATLANLPLDNNSTARSNLTRRPVRAAINSNASRVHNVGGKSGKWNQITTKEKVFGEGQNEGVHGLIARASLLRLHGPSNRTLS